MVCLLYKNKIFWTEPLLIFVHNCTPFVIPAVTPRLIFRKKSTSLLK